MDKNVKKVGIWVVASYQDGTLLKWGKNGDVQWPYPPDGRQAKKQMEHLAKEMPDNGWYYLHIFNNGQMLTEEYLNNS